MTNPIEAAGHPLAFAMDDKAPPDVVCAGDGRAVIFTEARMLGGHQKEAVVHEGAGGPCWRLTSDEGKHLKGADVAPFPLGYFNAGMHGDLWAHLLRFAAADGVDLSDAKLSVRNFYWLTGSFIAGTGEGFCDDPEVSLDAPGVDAATTASLLDRALKASAAFDAIRSGFTNTFALFVNGRRLVPEGVTNSESPDAPDPYQTYTQPPSPAAGDFADVIRKTGTVEDGEIKLAPAATTSRVIRTVSGRSVLVDPAGLAETDTWLEMPGVSHFTLRTDARASGRAAPSGMALLNAGIAFCYLTQLSRYVEHMKLGITGLRLTQTMPVETADGVGRIAPVDTHLFMNGDADEAMKSRLLTVAARTCYLHATLCAERKVNVTEPA